MMPRLIIHWVYKMFNWLRAAVSAAARRYACSFNLIIKDRSNMLRVLHDMRNWWLESIVRIFSCPHWCPWQRESRNACWISWDPGHPNHGSSYCPCCCARDAYWHQEVPYTLNLLKEKKSGSWWWETGHTSWTSQATYQPDADGDSQHLHHDALPLLVMLNTKMYQYIYTKM